MAWGLGIAFSKKPEQTKSIALVLNETQTLNQFEEKIAPSKYNKKEDTASGAFFYGLDYGDDKVGITHYKIKPVNKQQAELMLKRGNASLLLSMNDSTLEYHFDRYNSDAQLSFLQLSALFKGETLLNHQTEVIPMTEKGTRYVDFLIPGLIAMNVMMSVMWGISYTLIENRTKKLLRRMVATPMPRWEYIASHIVARIILCFIEAIIIFSFAYYYFNITIEGSVIAFIILFLSGIVAFSGIAVLIASRTAKTQVGNGLINLIVMPMMLLSGIYFSYHNFPDKVIPLIQALPLTMLADGVRAIFNESAGIMQIWKYVIILNGLGLITFAFGLKIFKWY